MNQAELNGNPIFVDFKLMHRKGPLSDIRIFSILHCERSNIRHLKLFSDGNETTWNCKHSIMTNDKANIFESSQEKDND